MSRSYLIQLVTTVAALAAVACAPLASRPTTAKGNAPAAEGVLGGVPAIGRKPIVGTLPSAVPVSRDRAPAPPSPSDEAASPTPTPSPTPIPSKPVNLTAAHEAVRASLGSKLAGLARIGFMQEQARLLSNNSAGIIANNGAGIISNDAAGILSDNGLGYRLAQAAPAVTVGPLAGEVLALDYWWADDSRLLGYYDPATFSATNPALRRVQVNPAGIGTRETLRNVAEVWPSNLPKDYVDTQVEAGDDGRFLIKTTFRITNDATGLTQTAATAPGTMRWDDAKSGIQIDVEGFALSFPDDTASYSYRFVKLGQVEKGTLTKLRRRADKTVLIDLMYPELMGDVQARIEKTDGTLLYLKAIRFEGASQIFTYDLQDGLVLRFDRKAGDTLTGKLLIGGQEEADAKLERRSGSHVFSIAFPEDPTHPIVVGYGSLTVPEDPKAKAPVWTVATAAGSATAGRADGVGAAASFTSLAGLAASRVTPGRFYGADRGAHVVRVFDVAGSGAVTVGTYAGTGTAGAAEGARLQSTFNQPGNLAVGPDDTLYVSDTGNRKIRRIAPDGTVSTYAGSGAVGAANGPAASATFMMPAGLALDASGALWVSDAAAHTLRKVTADGTVSTVAGTPGQAGRTDGVGAAARFNQPLGLAVNALGHVLVADNLNFALRQVTADGTVSTLAGNADPNRAGLDGDPLMVCLNGINAIAIGPSGRPYLGGDNVRMLRADGKIGSYAGAHASFHQDSNHVNAGFTSINGLVFGPNGVLYVADGTRLRSITPKNAPTP